MPPPPQSDLGNLWSLNECMNLKRVLILKLPFVFYETSHTDQHTHLSYSSPKNKYSNLGYIRFELWFPIKYAKAYMNSMDYDQPLKGHILDFTEG